jgi:HEAT repeats/Putative zinc-finger
MVIRCEDMEQLAVLYAYEELSLAERAALETHTAGCHACAAVLSRELLLHQAISSIESPVDSLDPSGLLLGRCRSELAEALDDHQQARAKQPRWWAVFSPDAWWGALRHTLVAHPAMSMAVLIVAGFLAGLGGQRWRGEPFVPAQPVLTVSVPPKLTEQQLQSVGGANVSWVTPSSSRVPTVQVQLMAQTPMSIVGSPDDDDVRRALTFVLMNGQRFDPGARLDSLEVLRTRSQDLEVRRALCAAARADQNVGVRIKALETLHGLEQDPQVQQTIIQALMNDTNSGVRVEAMNLLVQALHADGNSGSTDPQILSVLRDRLQNDPNQYIRLQSEAALRELGSAGLP